jgi:putative transposase
LRSLIDPTEELSVRRQCELLELPPSTYYYVAAEESPENLAFMRLIDEEYMRHPFFGSRQITQWLKRNKHPVNRKRVQRLMRRMGLEALCPGARTTRAVRENKVYPYLLRDVAIVRCDQVWSTDITYLPLRRGFMYLVAVMDWHSRFVLSWELSNTLESTFCLTALESALRLGHPEIFNTDQGSQFTSATFTSRLEAERIAISMDGRGRALDNVFIERLWRSLKYEDVYLKDYADAAELYEGLATYFAFYNEQRTHSALSYRTPREVYKAQRRRSSR